MSLIIIAGATTGATAVLLYNNIVDIIAVQLGAFIDSLLSCTKQNSYEMYATKRKANQANHWRTVRKTLNAVVGEVSTQFTEVILQYKNTILQEEIMQ